MVSAYFGVANVLDYRQSRKENFLWVDRDGTLDVTQLWGPNLGRSAVAGVKLSF